MATENLISFFFCSSCGQYLSHDTLIRKGFFEKIQGIVWGISVNHFSCMEYDPRKRLSHTPEARIVDIIFLKCFCKESANSSVWQCDEKAFQNWIWITIEPIASIRATVLCDRLSDSQSYVRVTYCSVDGTDCRIQEPVPFNSKWFSHKFHMPGVRCEIAISNHSGRLVWINGPFCCGEWSYLKIFQSRLSHMLLSIEKVVADSGYHYYQCVTPDSVSSKQKAIHSKLRARHETCNARLKHFNVLSHTFRHSVSSDAIVFHAVAKLTALSIKLEDPLFTVDG